MSLDHTLRFSLFTLLVISCSNPQDGARCSLSGDCPNGGQDTLLNCTPEEEANGECVPDDDNDNNKDPVDNTPAITCSTTKSKEIVAPNEVVEFTLNVSGGSSPYSTTTASSFASSTKVSRNYPAGSSSSSIVYDSVEVTDKNGKKGTCSFFVTVNSGTNASPSCTIGTSATSRRVNENITFTFTMSGGKSPYIVDTNNFNAGTGFTLISSFRNISVNVRELDGKYSSGGTKTTSFQFTDSNGVRTGCTGPTLTVRNPQITDLVASPSSTVSVGSTITLSANTSDFSSSPSITYSTNSSGVTLNQSANSATVTTSAAKQVVITAVATAANNDTATRSITLNFTTTNIICALSYSPSAPTVGQLLSFTLKNVATQASVLITEFDGVTIASPVSLYTKSYAYGGYITARAKGRSATGEVCNAGADSFIYFTVRSGLSCNAGTYPSLSPVNWSVEAYMTPYNSSGSAWITRVSSSLGCLVDDGRIDNWHRSVYFTSGCISQNAPVTIEIMDSSGQTATCSTTHWVYAW